MAMSPLTWVLILFGIASAFAWSASLFTGDTSWVDREWSIVPFVYAWVFALCASLHNTRLDLMAIVATVWGVRLTFNFARKGGYSGTEDYRWEVLRSSMSRTQFQLFNFFFIVLYQNALLVLITLPAWTAYQHRNTPLGGLGIVLVIAFLACTLGETIADQQQWNFHAWKNAELSAGRIPTPQFCQSGLFRFSRHPNFFFEQAQWWIFFLIGAEAAGSVLQWTVLGPFLLTLLFVGSTRFTEQISLGKYPEYADYQKQVSQQIPWLPKRRRSTASLG
jgi:steroid 5-alpha reductase family enzyme